MPEAHPYPPDDFADKELPLVRFDEHLWRISRSEYANPLHFGTSGDCRFDAPDGRFGVCYLACELPGAFIEVFGRSPGVNLVTMQALEQRQAAKILPIRPLEVVDLTAEGLARLGAESRLTSGGDYDVSQAWSAAIHAHPSQIDGILYRSRHDPAQFCLAAFDRCHGVLEIDAQVGLAEPSLRVHLAEVIDHYGFALA